MRLTDLDPEWLRDYDEATGSHYRAANLSVSSAQGILFECPLCRQHSILVRFADRGVPDSAEPGARYAPGEHADYPDGRRAQRWTASGSGFPDLTLKPSIDLSRGGKQTSGCVWHGFVTAGEAS